jgi:hypothetical protein
MLRVTVLFLHLLFSRYLPPANESLRVEGTVNEVRKAHDFRNCRFRGTHICLLYYCSLSILPFWKIVVTDQTIILHWLEHLIICCIARSQVLYTLLKLLPPFHNSSRRFGRIYAQNMSRYIQIRTRKLWNRGCIIYLSLAFLIQSEYVYSQYILLVGHPLRL